MPGEIRYLLFSDAEAIMAMIEYDRRVARIVPSPEFAALKLFGEQPSSIVLCIDRGRHQANIKIEGEQMLAALILYCHRKRVPLPARGSKALSVVHGRLAVLVRLPMDEAAVSGGARTGPPESRHWQPRFVQ
jgi:hypothetical protein